MNFKQRSRSGFKEKSSDLRKVITVSGCMFLLLTVEGSNLWANSFMNPSQQVIKLSSKMQDVTVQEVLASVEQQTDYHFTYNPMQIGADRRVTIDLNNKSVTEILDELFLGKKVRYVVEGNNIVLFADNKKAEVKDIVQQKSKIVTGTVLDVTGMPVIGANVTVKGTTQGTITDMDGKFSLEVVEGDILQVTYIGFANQEVKVGTQTNLSVTLKEDAEALDELVVVGYGTQKKVNLTGAVETVKAEQINKKQVNSLAEALTGEAPGMTIVQRSGQPGSPSTSINIRGIGTWGNSSPLVIVDGVPMDMANVIPTDVENVTILKDAASAAIYGSRAANGVILVTTKQGKQGKMSISYSGNVGVQNPVRIPEMAESWQYAELYNQSMENEGKTSSLFPEDRIDRMKKGGDPDKLEGSTDWFKELMHSAIQHSHNISFQGGSDKTVYLGSLGYFDQDGLVETTSYKRYNMRLNTSTKFTDWFKLDANMTYINDDKEEPSSGVYAAFYQAGRAVPYMPVKFSDGTWSLQSVATNPIRMVSSDYGVSHLKGNKTSILLSPSINPLDGWEVKGSLGYELHTYDQKMFTKTVSYEDFTPAGQVGSVIVPRNEQMDKWEQYKNLTASVTSTYEKTFNEHSFKVLLGASAESYKYRYTKASRKDFPSNDLGEINAGDPNTASAEGNSTYSALASLYGRINYVFADKYLFEVNVRYDGSSKFIKGNQWGVFPSFSLGWRVSEEMFFETLLPYIQNLKIRGSWGRLGNQQISDYQGYSTFGSGYAYLFDGVINTGYKEAIMGNPYITWETSNNFNIAMDLSFFNNKMNMTFDYYQRITDDILLQLETPALLGISPSMSNAGSVENRGWELSLEWRDKIGDDFNYSIGFNLSDVKNKVLDLQGYKSPSNSLTTRIEGEPLNAIYGWETLGICTTEEQYNKYSEIMKSYNINWGIGDIIIKDRNNDHVIDASDKTVIGNQIPRFNYNMNLGFSYKNWDFSCLFQGVGKVDGYMGIDVLEPLGTKTALKEHYTESFNPQNPNPDAYYPRMLNSSRLNYGNFSHWVQDASYLRLKDIQLGYTFDLKKYKINSLRLSISGQNLFTITKFRVFDPESNINSYSYPNVSTVSFGLNLTF